MDFKRRLVATLGLSAQGQEAVADDASSGQGRVLAYLRRHGTVRQDRLLTAIGGEAALRRLVRQGLVARQWRWQEPRAAPMYRDSLRLAVLGEEARATAAAMPVRATRQRGLLEHLAGLSPDEPQDAALARKEFGSGAVASLQRKGLVELDWRQTVRDPLEGRVFAPEAPLELTESQERAVQAIREALDGLGSQRAFLLEGVTGSGKTEVYLQALAHCISRGKRGILLVPEISLTPQMTQRLSSRFPGRVAVLHSGLTPGQQYDTWWRIRRGEFDVVLGSRSAVFAPQPDLGLIVLDEEHERTYKQDDPAPRYHAREVALKLAELVGAVVVLGGATPDVVTHHRALTGAYRLLRLAGRLVPGPHGQAVAAPLARVQVVDMREELKAGVRSIFSRALHDALVETLNRGEQAILFLNRRGTAGTVQCRECGHVLECRRCQAPLTYHGAEERLLCHRCGSRSRMPPWCPRCRSRRIRYLGLGTQRVAQEVERTFGVPALRWDRDAAREQRAHQTLMDRFAAGEAPVLVGTQMIAKGLHLPQVTLVGAILADLGLYLPDFRAGEWAFQLLCQVSGRAGRGSRPGQAIIQTYSPDHYAIRAAAAQDYDAFYAQEIGYRRAHAQPPFSRMLRLLYEHTNEAYAQRQATELARAIREELERQGLGEVDVIGPAPRFFARVRGRYRWQLAVRVPPTAAVDVPALLASLTIPPGWRVDVDPGNLL
jgi:primosomal protein N' (replication factor Y)